MCLQKTFAIILNALLVISGIVLLAGATIVHFILLKKLSNDKVDMGWIVVVLGIAGALAVLAAILGLCGVICCDSCFPILVAVVLIGAVVILDITFVAEIGGTSSEFQEYLKHEAKEHMHKYGEDINATAEWDVYQNYGECCGLTSANDWVAIGKDIPVSCCKGEDNVCDTKDTDQLHKNGCYIRLQDLIDGAAMILEVFVIILMLVQFAVGLFDVVLLLKMAACACSDCCSSREVDRI